MRHFMPDRLLDQFPEMLRTPRQPFVWTLEDRDAVRQDETVRDAASSQRPALVEAEQNTAARTAEPAALPRRRLALDDHGDVAHPLAESPGHLGVGFFDQLVKFALLHPSTLVIIFVHGAAAAQVSLEAFCFPRFGTIESGSLMNVQLDWPPDVVDRLTEEARREGLSLDAYLLQTVLQQKGSNGAPADNAEKRRKRADAGARILEIQKRVKPDPEGWTSSDYINYGRR
jgi:hypothetical protein